MGHRNQCYSFLFMICLVDGNNFFVSCERVFNPKLKNQKVVVLSNNDGCVISRSNEAKAIGIKMGQPIFELKNIIEKENVHVFSSNFILYGDMSDRIMSHLSQFSPEVEVYSIDEAFCDLSFLPQNWETLNEYGWKIKNTIKQGTGIPCGIGISYTKVLAKIANRIAKKSPKANGVLALIEDSHIEQALALTEVGDIWGIGRQYANFLKQNNIFTAKNFRDADENWVLKNMTIVGLKIQKELKKENCMELELFSKPKKSIVVSRSFAQYLHTQEELLAPFSHFVSSGCAKMRKQKSECSQIAIYLRTNPFAKNKPQYRVFQNITLPFYTSCDFHILHAVETALRNAYREGYEYKKGGVYFFSLSPQSNLPSNLFDQRDILKERLIFEQYDIIRKKFGLSSLSMASALNNSWKPKFLLKSPNYTSKISETILV